jgi:hypothetical protein
VARKQQQKVFSVGSVPICYKQKNWNNGLVVGQLAADKNVRKEAEDIVGIRHQATTREDTADWEEFVRAAVKCSVFVWINVSAIVTFSYDL